MQVNSEYLHPDKECLSREEIEALQVKRLQETLRHCMNSPFYKKKFEEMGIKPEDIKSVADVRKLPFTTKQDLRDTYPFGLASVPLEKCVRLHSSSGTTGNPTVILHTQKDLDEWANAVARCLWMVGLRPNDVFQNSSGYGMFTGGLGFQYGAERLGMLTVPAAAGNTLRQIKFITDFGTTAIHAVPSYVTRIKEVMDQQGIDPRKDTKLRILAIGAEPHSEEQRKRIENMLGVKAYNSFGMSEMCGPGVAFECKEQNGLHFWEDYYIVEIVDPETLEPVPDGEIGELVLTTINREAMPLIRYRTRDLTRVLGRTCPCGRNHIRLDRMKGRSDDMMVLRGVNIFPIQIEKILLQFKELSTNYLITLTTDNDNDNMTVEVELASQPADSVALAKEITRRLKDEILLTPHVKLLPLGTLPQSEGKAVRVKDLRTVYQ
ncbi:MAG: phenylacetate--CoA ligase [Paludibacteraceae bacterium]|nr:phenylacetate--CoA ligase [Paludibacteraceae bacterium]